MATCEYCNRDDVPLPCHEVGGEVICDECNKRSSSAWAAYWKNKWVASVVQRDTLRDRAATAEVERDKAREAAMVVAAACEEEAQHRASVPRGGIVVARHVDGGLVWTWCEECGPNVLVDGDGCCIFCGHAAIWYGKPTASLRAHSHEGHTQ